jgi:hypothetical protein
MKCFKYVALLCFAFAMTGCASNMALTKGQDKIDTSAESIALVTVKVSNTNKTGYQPDLSYAFFFAKSDGAEKKRFDIKTDPYKSAKNEYNEYLLSFSLKPGKYDLASIWATYSVPLLLKASCVLPLNTIVEVKPNTVVYLGNIDAVIREKKESTEVRAGTLIPLLDQALAGFSTGTFDIGYKDNYDEDIKAYQAQYPALQKVQIEKSILTSWRRPESIVGETLLAQ